MDSSKIKAILIAVVATFAALYLGITAATAQFETVIWIVGVTTLVVCLLLGRKIWLLIPFMSGLDITVMISGRPTLLQLAEILVLGFSLLLFLSRKLRYHFRFTELEVWMLLLVLCVCQVYLRNPVGVNLIGSSSIGGRPYIIFTITVLIAFLLAGLKVEEKELKTAMKLNILGGLLNGILGFIGWLFPAYSYWFGSVQASQENSFAPVDTERAGRIPFLSYIPLTLSNWVASHESPLRACFRLRWLPLILLSIAFAGMSGYRNVVGAVAMTYLVGVYYRGGITSLIISGICGIFALGALAITNAIAPLPPNMQRALSFLPGSWNQRYVESGEDSSDWRFEMWREVLTTDRWISNKLLGDGLGFTAVELAMQENLITMHKSGIGTSGFDYQREVFLMSGDYHSGPVSAIRTIGYVGLIIMAIAQLRLVVHAHRQIQRTRGTEWFVVTLFFCIPIIWTPAFFWLIFGGFAKDAPLLLMQAAMLRMLQNNLPLPAYAPRQRRFQPAHLNNHTQLAES